MNDPAVNDPAVNDPAVENAAVENAAVEDPAVNDPAVNDPAVNDTDTDVQGKEAAVKEVVEPKTVVVENSADELALFPILLDKPKQAAKAPPAHSCKTLRNRQLKNKTLKKINFQT